MDLLSMLMGSLTSSSSVDSLAQKSGGSQDQVTKLLGAAVPMLVKSLTKNASSEEGAASLAKALTQHTSTETMANQIAGADEVDGGKILKHILGDQTSETFGALAGESGMSKDQVTKALGSMAPALLSGLSAATSSAQKKGGVDLSDGIDLSDVMGLLGGAQESSGGGGLSGILGSLFGGKEEKDTAANGTDLMKSLLSMMN